MLKTVTLDPYALASVEAARDAIKSNDFVDDDLIARAVNDATFTIEGHCGRLLKSRARVWILGERDIQSYGSASFMVGWSIARVPDWPVTAIAKLQGRIVPGQNFEDLDSTGWTEFGGILTFPLAALPRYSDSVRIESTAGYLAGTHDRDLRILEEACLRLVPGIFQDSANQVGRATSLSVGNKGSKQLVPDAIPNAVKVMLLPYMSIG